MRRSRRCEPRSIRTFSSNALNALNAIIPKAAMDARRTLLNLADIFRYSLDSKQQFVTLEDEMRIVEAYLQIERLRLGNRLTTRIDMRDGVRRWKVPALSIQPLVENAVKHGVSSMANGGEVRVSAHRNDGSLQIEVSDDGPGFDPQALSSRGHGLRSVERRLHLCYGGCREVPDRCRRVGYQGWVPSAARHARRGVGGPARDAGASPSVTGLGESGLGTHRSFGSPQIPGGTSQPFKRLPIGGQRVREGVAQGLPGRREAEWPSESGGHDRLDISRRGDHDRPNSPCGIARW